MASFCVVCAFLFLPLSSDAQVNNSDLLLGKDEQGQWWPVTIISENDDTVSCVVQDDVGTIWPIVHRENLKQGTAEDVLWIAQNSYENTIENSTDKFQVAEHSLTEWWRYNPCNGKPAAIREDAAFGAKKTGSIMQPGEVFQVDGSYLDAEGMLHLRLADGRGWLFKQIPGGCSVCFPADGLQPQWWRYLPFNGKPMNVREDIGANAKRTSKVMMPGDVFQVNETLEDARGVLHLRLSDGSGYLFDRTPDGELCRLIDQ